MGAGEVRGGRDPGARPVGEVAVSAEGGEGVERTLWAERAREPAPGRRLPGLGGAQGGCGGSLGRGL